MTRARLSALMSRITSQAQMTSVMALQTSSLSLIRPRSAGQVAVCQRHRADIY